MHTRRFWIPVMAVALVLAVIGCGSSGTLSLAQYKDQAGEIHNDVGVDLNAIFDEANALDVESLADMQAFGILVSSAVDSMDQGVGELEDLVPPDAAKNYQRRLLEFYDSSLITLETLERDTNYTIEALTGLTSMESLAMTGLTSLSTPEQTLAAVQQDLATVQALTAELANTPAPPDFTVFQQQVVSSFQQFANILQAMVPAIQSSDVATLSTLADQASALEGQISIAGSIISDVFDQLGTEIDDMAAEGAQLQDELEAL